MNVCKACHSSCETCVGTTINDCTSCKSPQIFEINMCVNTLATGRYKRTDTTFVVGKTLYFSDPCDSSCYTCTSNTSTDCTACLTGSNLYLTPTNECLNNYVVGYFKNTSTQKFQICPAPCTAW